MRRAIFRNVVSRREDFILFQVKGFQLEYLVKVPEVKDTVHKHSLLHHLCHMVMEKFPDSTDLYSEVRISVSTIKTRENFALSWYRNCTIVYLWNEYLWNGDWVHVSESSLKFFCFYDFILFYHTIGFLLHILLNFWIHDIKA